MADSSVGKKILNWLDNLFKTLASPISGYDVFDVQAKQDGDNFSSMFQFETSEVKDEKGKAITDINNNKLDIYVLLKTLNAQTVLNPILNEINQIGDKDFEGTPELLKKLFGPDYATESDLLYHENDSEKNGDGLLGFRFTDAGEGPNIMREIWFGTGKEGTQNGISGTMQYALECECPGKDYGAISGVNLERCGELIAEYLEIVGAVKNRAEVKIDSVSLVTPLLATIQKFVGEYWNDAVKKYGYRTVEKYKNADNGKPQDTPDNPEDTNAPEGDQNNPPAPENNSGEGDIVTSKHIDVTLQKITGTTACKMTAIKANYDYADVLSDIDEIINQDEFIQALPEVPTSYAIDVDDDGFDIEPCEECIECDPCESLAEIFKAGIRAYRNLYIIHWMSYGNDMMKLHLLAEDMYEELIKEIDTLGELLVEKCDTVPQLDFPCDYVAVQNYDFQSGLDVIQSLINMYIDCIDYAYCNQDSDIQSTLDEWLRYWKKQMKYFVERQEG